MNIKMNFLLQLILFFLAYFYYDHLGINKIPGILIIGIFIAVSAYVLHEIKFNFWVKSIVLLCLCLATYLIPMVFDMNTKKIKLPMDNRLYGVWITDTVGGYSIKIEFKKDSAYLSQSNLPLLRGYQIFIEEDTLVLISEELGKKYKWKYSLQNNDSELRLNNIQDSLLLREIK